MTFNDVKIDYNLEITTLRKALSKANSLQKYDNILRKAILLLLNSNGKFLKKVENLIYEIEQRKEMAIKNNLIL